MSTIVNRSTLINQVHFDINIHVTEKSLKELLAFLEFDQSIGGKIASHDLIQSKYQSSLTVQYQNSEIANRVLAKKFIKYKFYYLRASQSGYKLDAYDINSNRIVIQCANKYNSEDNVKKYVANNYANNQVIDFRASRTFPNTYYITFKYSITKEESTNPRIWIKMRVLNSYSTKTILFKPKSYCQLSNFEVFKKRIKLELLFKMLNTVFIDEADTVSRCFYVQFDTHFEMKEFMRSVLNVVYDETVICEYCFNFELKNVIADFL